jgi:EAL domain-containing protein (putative c-di-GMP-specific phosphodiesterase class I)
MYLQPEEFAENMRKQLRTARAGHAVAMVLRLDRNDLAEAAFMDADALKRTSLLLASIDAMMQPTDCIMMPSPDAVWIWLGDVASQAVATVAARRLLETLRRHANDNGHVLRASVGLAGWPMHGATPGPLFMAAQRVAQVATNSHEFIAWYNPEAHSEGEMEERSGIANLLADNGVMVHLQPIVSFSKGAKLGAEALLRLPPDWAARYSPFEFVTAAERAGLAVPLLKTVLSGAARGVAELAGRGLLIDFSVNVSPQALRDPLLPEIVVQGLATWRVAPAQLTLEVTEGSLIDSADKAVRTLSALKVRGVGIAIDDFGTGFSSLGYLQRLPLSKLKIDRSFVADMLQDKSSLAIVRSVLDLAHNFSLEAIAEGVEEPAIMEALRSMGAHAIQGYLLAPAMPVDEFHHWAQQQGDDPLSAF